MRRASRWLSRNVSIAASPAAGTLGLTPAELRTIVSAGTIENLNLALPATWSKGNPVDIIGDAGPDRYRAALEVLIEARNADYADRREVKGISTWGDAMRAAWAVERRVDAERREQAEREIASALARPIAGYAAERLAAECLPWGMEAERLRRLADIARREAANI